VKINVVVFSGIDGCGKSTQIELLADHFESHNIKYKKLWVRPGSTPFMLFIKSIARLFVRTLPKPGRSDQREKLLKRSRVGNLWFYLTFLDLIWIYQVKTPILVLLGYKVIYDRHIFDSIIDYQVMLERNLFDNKLVKRLLLTTSKTVKIYLEIPIELSIDRCSNKWEPYPDTEHEKIIRHAIYNEHISGFDYFQFDGTRQPGSIHKSILQLILN
jgi:thymidylate kinase